MVSFLAFWEDPQGVRLWIGWRGWIGEKRSPSWFENLRNSSALRFERAPKPLSWPMSFGGPLVIADPWWADAGSGGGETSMNWCLKLWNTLDTSESKKSLHIQMLCFLNILIHHLRHLWILMVVVFPDYIVIYIICNASGYFVMFHVNTRHREPSQIWLPSRAFPSVAPWGKPLGGSSGSCSVRDDPSWLRLESTASSTMESWQDLGESGILAAPSS